jgi:hypothetical protein
MSLAAWMSMIFQAEPTTVLPYLSERMRRGHFTDKRLKKECGRGHHA